MDTRSPARRQLDLVRAGVRRSRLGAERALFELLDVHRPSAFPASRGPHRGKEFCVACSLGVGDRMVYVPMPCDVVRTIATGLRVELVDPP
jgi:hypothetical protein